MDPVKQGGDAIVLVRAKYLLHYINWFRGIGAPVDRELRKARLPTLIEEMPDEFVSMDLAYRFLMSCVRAEGIDDIGFDAGWKLNLDDFGPILKNALHAAPTGKSRLECFARLAVLENDGLRCRLEPGADMTRILIRHYYPPGADSLIADWANVKAVIEVIQSVTGPHWLPPVIGFESSTEIARPVQERLGNVRILTGQPVSFILIPNRVLATPSAKYGAIASDRSTGPGSYTETDHAGLSDDGLVDRLREVLTPYLASGYPSIELAAEIAGTSVRSLQRRLGELQTSYTELIDRIRFGRAVQLLRDSELKILDIALALGYRDASNFTRAFRRIGGVSPREMRRQWSMGDDTRSMARNDRKIAARIV